MRKKTPEDLINNYNGQYLTVLDIDRVLNYDKILMTLKLLFPNIGL